MIEVAPGDSYVLRECAPDVLAYLTELQTAFEKFDLKLIPFLQKRLKDVHLPRLRGLEVKLDFHAGQNPAAREWLGFVKTLSSGCQTLSGPINPANPMNLLLGFHSANETAVRLFGYRLAVPSIERFFLEEAPPEGFREPDPKAAIEKVPLLVNGVERSHALLYRPSGRNPGDPRPLALCLHGAMGSSAEFMAIWLRALHSHCWYGLVPKSPGMTWDPKGDFPALLDLVRRTVARENIDPQKILVTGLSDGGSAALELAFTNPGSFAAASCVSGVLKPWVPVESCPKKFPVHLMHGSNDMLFPVQLARSAEARLRSAGISVKYVEIQGMNHAYPISKNRDLVGWFEGQ